MVSFHSHAFHHCLASNERFRLKNGNLMVEDSSVRTQMNAWQRFWSRDEYSQSAILTKMGELYKAATKAKPEYADNFLNNYRTLVNRAILQNETKKDFNWIIRFFKGKTEINVKPSIKKINKLMKIKLKELKTEINKPDCKKLHVLFPFHLGNISSPKDDASEEIKLRYQIELAEKMIEIMEGFKSEESLPWWGRAIGADPFGNDYELDEPFLDSDQRTSVLDQFTSVLGITLKDEQEMLNSLLEAAKLVTARDFSDKDIHGPMHLTLYLLTHKKNLIKEIERLNLLEGT